MFKKNIFSFALVIIIFALDRITKLIIIIKLRNLEEININSFLNLNLIWNEGIAFGLFSFANNTIYNLITFLIMIVIFIIFMMIVKSNGFKKYSLLMVLGGAFGNVYDRIIFGAVPDFIDFHIGNFHWFIFNVSDIFITIGVFCLIMVELFNVKQSDIDEKN